MDYVQSVLARQRRLLSLLLLGREQETKQESEWLRQASYTGAEEQAASVLQRLRKENVKQPEETAEESFWSGVSAARFRESRARSTALSRQAATLAPQRQYRRMPESGMAYISGKTSGDGGVQLGGAWSAAAAADSTRRGAQTAPFAAGDLWQEQLSARAVSLAFERDARRYDGGFSLY